MTAVAVIAAILAALVIGLGIGYTLAENRAEARQQYELAQIEDAENERTFDEYLRARWGR